MKTTLNPFENAKRTAQGAGGGVSPAIIEEMQAEITDIKSQLTELAGNYSTTEHKTGRKWIDGSDIYEKSVVLESMVIEKDTAFNICDAIGIAKVFFGEFYSTGEGGGNNLATWIEGDYVKGKSCATYSSGTVTVTITYTKATA